MSAPTKREPTPEEAAALAEIATLQDRIDALQRVARPLIRFDTDGDPYCPWCGAYHLQFVEDTPSVRTGIGTLHGSRLPISGDTDHSYDGCHSDRFACGSCCGESQLADTITIDWQ